MTKGIEQYSGDIERKTPSVIGQKKERPAISRREFLGGMGVLAALGAGAVLGSEKTRRAVLDYWESIISAIPPEYEKEPGQYHIVPEPISRIIRYDAPPIRLEAERISRLREYWKRRYQDPNDTNGLSLKLRDSLLRMKPWDERIKMSFTRRGIPPELRYISIVESDFMLGARSFAGAVGPFQFMKKTAESYGLKVGHLIDERRDPIRSGEAASRFLYDLYKETGDMTLALASYNGGFARAYLEIERKNPTYNGFLKFMEDKLNYLKQSIASGNFEHTVLPGQNLWQISRRYGIRADDLKKANSAGSRNLRAGEKLKIPFAGEAHKKTVFDKLTRGFKENINFPHQVNAVMDVIKEGGKI